MDWLCTALLVGSVVGGLWVGTRYVLFRLLGCRKSDATVFAFMGLVSATALFWQPIPNSYSWGSLSIVLALLLYAEQRPAGASRYVAASALTWQWDGHAMRVTLRGPAQVFRFGAAFPPGAGLTVTHKPATP
ncbi:MAG: hypothetical protein NTNFB01_17240 [Nitrospira sp.]|jgi:hypothetical protein